MLDIAPLRATPLLTTPLVYREYCTDAVLEKENITHLRQFKFGSTMTYNYYYWAFWTE